ncbi:hypothetical protein Tco_0887248 [Tanacetum coccineum]
MTNNINHLKEIVDQAWVKHSNDRLYLRNPTAQDMEILVKICLMLLALKTQNDSFAFIHELKQEMHADLKYVESLEDEIDELESDKAEFSNMYDTLLQECVSKDVMCSYLQSSSDLDKITELQCLYLHKEREQYFEIQDLKAQLQDKNITVSELKKLIEKCKGKSVDTKLDKPSVVRQPNAQRIPKPLVLGKPAPFSDSLERTNFAKKKSVSKTNKSEGLSKPVTPHNLPQTAMQAEYSQKLMLARPQPRSNQMKCSVLAKHYSCEFKKTDFATYGKCVFNSNHDACVSKFLNDVTARTKKPKVVPISTRKPKSQANKSVATHRKKTVASESIITNSKSY